jgi:adenylosuccinate lyase
MKQIIPNILASRYATPEMVYIWSMENKVKLERQFWIAALKAQRDWGIEIAPEAIEAYESVAHIIDLESPRCIGTNRRIQRISWLSVDP